MRWSLIVLAVALASCRSDNNGPGDSAALVAGNEDHDFGTMTVGQQTSAVVLTFTNTGDGPSAALSVFIEGPSADELLVSSDECEGRELGPQESCQVAVAFRAAFSGAKEAVVRVQGGPGETASTTVRGMVGGGTMSASPGALEFGDVRVATSSPARGILIRNASPRATGPLTVEIIGAHAADFIVTLDACVGASLAGGFSCGISIRFQPSASGERTATLRVTGNDGVATAASLRGAGGAPTFLSVTPSQHGFGAIRVSQSTTASFTVRNDGPSASGAMSFQLGGANAGNFRIDSNSCSGQSLAVGATCAITVRFQPSLAGTKTADLAISSAFAEAVIAGLSGEGIVLTLVSSPPSIAFGPTLVRAASEPQTVIITNTGNVASEPMRTEIHDFSGYYYYYYDPVPPQFEIVTNTCAGTALAPGASCSVSVRFEPQSLGTHSGSLSLYGDPGLFPTHSVNLTGGAVGISSTVFALDFPPTAVGATSAAFSVGIFNTGTTPTGPLTAALDGSGFSITSDDCSGTVLAGKATCTISLRFSPQAPGFYQGVISVTGTPGGGTSTSLRGQGL